LSVRRGRAAVEFYKRAFGAVEVYRVGGTDQHEPVVSELSVGGATFWVSDESPEHFHNSPETLSRTTTRILLVADDPAAAAARAVAAGAIEVYSGQRGAWVAVGSRGGSVRAPVGDRKAAGAVAAGSSLSRRRMQQRHYPLPARAQDLHQ
jgi:uncharacterized glyoxalase superfamily protein PhnB